MDLITLIIVIPAFLAVSAIDYKPLCASDGITYHNEDALIAAQNSTDTEIFVVKQRPCYGNDISGICGCILRYEPVCGTDGNTYPNLCHLKCMANKSKWNISVAYHGECVRIPDDPNCNCARVWTPDCSHDDVTYDSECILDCATKRNATIKLTYSFRCSPNIRLYIENVRGANYTQK